MINTEEKSRVPMIDVIKGIHWQGILLCLMSFVIGRVCIFDTFYTLGIAYVAAMFFNKSTRRWSMVLCLLGILSVGMIDFEVVKYMLMLVIIAVLREAMIFFKYEINLRNQLLVLGISILSINCMSLALQDFTIYRAITSLLETAVALGLMSILNLALTILYEGKRGILTEYEVVSIAFLMALFVCGVIDFYVTVPVVERVYLKDVFVFIVLIGVTYLGGIGSGLVVSVIISTVLVVIGYMPASFMGIYVFAALVGGLFYHLERLGVIFAMTLGLLLGFALFNNRVIDMPILGAYLCAIPISLLIPKSYFGMANWFGYGIEVDEEQHLLHVQAIITEQLKRFSAAFEGLGKEFEHIALKNMTLDVKQMNQIIEDTGESLCKDCAMCQFCWIDYIKETYRSGYKMLEVLDKKGQISVGDIPPEFKKACINAESFAYALGLKLDVFQQACRWQKQFEEARGLISEEFRGISTSVEGLAANIEGDFCFNKEDEKRIKDALHSYGIRTRDIMVVENNGRKYEVHIYCNYKGEPEYKEKVVAATQKALGLYLEIEKYEYFVEDRYCYFKMGVKKQFAITASAYNKAKDNVCGDVYSFMELDDGNYLLAIADGMGSGQAARRESETTIELLEKFLEAGFDSEVALRTINSALVLKSDIECYTTMDMALFNQHTGVIEFLKMGACTSFIVRGEEIITVKASSLPIGILSHVDLVSCKKQLKDGDIVIMVSDGILENRNNLSDGETTFKHFIVEAKSNSPEYLAKFLLNKAKNLLAGQEGDDMTVVVARVWKQY
ncbi:MAG: SpoIIE family protein phosphatase [Cellulosilyticum sp.]|nr:SpoIIE family protein phosphatase [Cellulosilyticum sp.]